MTNAYRGEASVTIDGRPHVVCFDWSALAALRTEFGKEWVTEVGEALNTLDVERIAVILAIGLRRHHDGDWTGQAVMDASPPVAASVRAIEEAMTRSSWGPDGPPEEKTASPPMARLRMLLSRAFGLPARSDFNRANSGA